LFRSTHNNQELILLFPCIYVVFWYQPAQILIYSENTPQENVKILSTE